MYISAKLIMLTLALFKQPVYHSPTGFVHFVKTSMDFLNITRLVRVTDSEVKVTEHPFLCN